MENHLIDLKQHFSKINDSNLITLHGKITQITGLVIESYGPNVSIGELCHIICKGSNKRILVEVVGFREDKILLMPFEETRGICPGSEVVPVGIEFTIRVGEELLGRVLGGLGSPIDNKCPIISEQKVPVYRVPHQPLLRRRITEPLSTGIRAIDGLLSCGKGQRMGIFAGSGVGKSVLLGMIARYTQAQVNVIGLIGERGREVREFIEKDLGEEGLKKSVVIVATSDQPPLVRIRAALIASTIAEYFRDKGKDVVLMMDSVTRFAMAQREVGLAIGEPPTSKGYPPSVFAVLPKLLERAGTHADAGSITGLYTVLVEADDMNDPIADTVRSILDGHIVLSRNLASKNHYPAIDILQSISRVMSDVTSFEHQKAAANFKEALSIYRESEDLINIGAYVPGSNPKVDYSIKYIDELKKYLCQSIDQGIDFKDAVGLLTKIFKENKYFEENNVKMLNAPKLGVGELQPNYYSQV